MDESLIFDPRVNFNAAKMKEFRLSRSRGGGWKGAGSSLVSSSDSSSIFLSMNTDRFSETLRAFSRLEGERPRVLADKAVEKGTEGGIVGEVRAEKVKGILREVRARGFPGRQLPTNELLGEAGLAAKLDDAVARRLCAAQLETSTRLVELTLGATATFRTNPSTPRVFAVAVESGGARLAVRALIRTHRPRRAFSRLESLRGRGRHSLKQRDGV